MHQESSEAPKFSFELKNAADITDAEKDELMELSIKMFPEFADLYRQNKYFSAFEPQQTWIVRTAEHIVGTGKFLWQDITVGEVAHKLTGFGVLVLDEFQKSGIGSEIVDRAITESKTIGADLVFASSTSSVVEKMLTESGFVKLSVPVYYNAVKSGEKKILEKDSYMLELQEGVTDNILALGALHLGRGPV